MKQLFLLILFCCATNLCAQNIIVDSQSHSPQKLVEEVLIDSGCIENITATNSASGNFGGTEKSFGYFDANASGFPFENGIIMSTGKLSNAPGPNNSLSDDDAPNWNGDHDLEQVLGINNTKNATILEFDFTPHADKIRFRYIFASEEYQEDNQNTCIYSDVFAFLIKPIGGQYTNIALVPGTTTPVKVTTVHPEIPGGCNAENEAYFDSFNGSAVPINFNGQTIALSAESNVVPGQMYHIKLVIADDQNYRYDSAVFLEAGSFNIGADLGNDLVGSNALCENETHLLQATGTNNPPMGYKWFKNGVEIPNETTDSYLVTEAGAYKIEMDYGNGCIAVDEVIVQYYNLNGISNQTISACGTNDDGSAIFDLTEVETDILQQGTSLQIIGYFLNETATDPISNPENFQNTTSSQMVYVKISESDACEKIVPIELIVLETPTIDPESVEQFFCKENVSDSWILVSGIIGNENEHNFLWNTGETTSTIEVSEPGEYSVEIIQTETINGSSYSCSTVNTIVVSISEKAVFNIEIMGKMGNNRLEITTEGSGDYVFALNDGGFQTKNIFPVSGGRHTVFVKDLNGCGLVSKTISVLDYPEFFTPNGDGTNDYWQLRGLNPSDLQVKHIHIFDRYGKLLETLSPYDHGWNGTYNGKRLPSNEYWFRVEFRNEPAFNGHFSLIR